MFEFNFNTKVALGSGCRMGIYDNPLLIKGNLVCIVIDQALISNSMCKIFLSGIKCEKIIVECDISEPTYDKLEEKRILVGDKNPSCFIGIGGGSTLDMAKALSVLSSNKGSAISYRGFDEFNEPIAPIIAIPTTAGTGSEITPNASFIDTKEKKKLGINGEAIRPKYAFLDPDLTLSCPKAPTISAGVDSMVHSLEAFVAKKSNPLAKFFAKKGFNLVYKNLPKLIHDLENIDLRQKVMYGAFLSATALMNSGTGPAAAMSYPLGVYYGVAHGIGGAIFLPHVVEYNINNNFYDYGDMLESKNSKSRSKKENAKIFLSNLFDVWENIGVPESLNQFGLVKSEINNFTNSTMELKGALDQNPVGFGENEVSLILSKLIK